MVDKQSFTPDEWAKIAESVMLAGVAVTAADPSGLFGILKEGFVSSKALMDAKKDASASELIKAIVAEFETSEGRTAIREGLKARFEGAKPTDMTTRSIEALAEVGTIVDAKAPGEATAFKAWLYSISVKVAEASKEGGFLGFGGVSVSDAEKATIDQVGKALRII